MFGIFEASEAVVQQRMAICEQCDFFLKATSQCKKCGCFMHYKSKMKSAECPINKWKKEE